MGLSSALTDRRTLVTLSALHACLDESCRHAVDMGFADYACLSLICGYGGGGAELRLIESPLASFGVTGASLQRLGDRRLVNRVRCLDDRRRYALCSTAEGRSCVGLADEAIVSALIDASPSLDEASLGRLVKTMECAAHAPRACAIGLFNGEVMLMFAGYQEALCRQAARSDLSSARACVLVSLASSASPLSRADLVRKTGMGKGPLLFSLDLLISKGLVRACDDERGLFELTEVGAHKEADYAQALLARFEELERAMGSERSAQVEDLVSLVAYLFGVAGSR